MRGRGNNLKCKSRMITTLSPRIHKIFSLSQIRNRCLANKKVNSSSAMKMTDNIFIFVIFQLWTKSNQNAKKVPYFTNSETIHTMQQIIESQKEQLNSYQSERSVLERKYAQLQQQKLNDELSYENIVRRLKQELEKKQMEIEQMMNRFNSSEHGLMLLKLKNELEEPHQIEL